MNAARQCVASAGQDRRENNHCNQSKHRAEKFGSRGLQRITAVSRRPRTALSQCETDLSSFHFGPPGAWVPRRMHAKGIAMSACPGGALRALQHDQNPPGSCANVCGCVHVALDPRKGKTIARAQACSRRHLATFHLCRLPCSRLCLHRCQTSHLWITSHSSTHLWEVITKVITKVTSHLQVGETFVQSLNVAFTTEGAGSVWLKGAIAGIHPHFGKVILSIRHLIHPSPART